MLNLGKYKVSRRKQKNGKWKATVTTTIEIPDRVARKIMKSDNTAQAIEDALRFEFVKSHVLSSFGDD